MPDPFLLNRAELHLLRRKQHQAQILLLLEVRWEPELRPGREEGATLRVQELRLWTPEDFRTLRFLKGLWCRIWTLEEDRNLSLWKGWRLLKPLGSTMVTWNLFKLQMDKQEIFSGLQNHS